jgi:hypothetical protein
MTKPQRRLGPGILLRNHHTEKEMPTSYTEKVGTGEVTDFAEYAMMCARNFGVCITLRDDPLSGEVPEFRPDPHYTERLAEAREKIAEWDSMTTEQRMEKYEAECREIMEYARNGIQEVNEMRKRYEAMLKKARGFKPPTEEHKNYAKFIVDQLQQSIDFDCSTEYYDSLQAAPAFDDWVLKTQLRLAQALSSASQSLVEEYERCAKRNEWIDNLRKAIEAMK